MALSTHFFNYQIFESISYVVIELIYMQVGAGAVISIINNIFTKSECVFVRVCFTCIFLSIHFLWALSCVARIFFFRNYSREKISFSSFLLIIPQRNMGSYCYRFPYVCHRKNCLLISLINSSIFFVHFLYSMYTIAHLSWYYCTYVLFEYK